MKRTLTLSTLFLSLMAAPALAQNPSNGNSPSNGMFDRLQGSGKPFGGSVSRSGAGCGGCGSSVQQSRAQSQMNVIMPMIFSLDLSPEQKSTIETQLRTLQAQAGTDPKAFDALRKKTLRAVIATLTADQRSKLLNSLAK